MAKEFLRHESSISQSCEVKGNLYAAPKKAGEKGWSCQSPWHLEQDKERERQERGYPSVSVLCYGPLGYCHVELSPQITPRAYKEEGQEHATVLM